MHLQHYNANRQAIRRFSPSPVCPYECDFPTKAELKNYRGLKREIEDNRRRLHELRLTLNITGPSYAKALRQYIREIEHNLARCSLEYAKLQAFINGIEDSTLRRIFTMYYIYGWQWQKIAFAVGSQTESAPRLKLNRYLSSLKDG